MKPLNLTAVVLCAALVFARPAVGQQTPEPSMISNHYSKDAPCPHLPIQRVLLYEPQEDWTYSHHPFITFFEGRFYAMWSNGHKDEDSPGQRVLMSTSQDFEHWTEPAALVDSKQGRHSQLVLTAAGFYQHAGTLVAYYGQYEYAANMLDNGQRRPGEGDRGHQDTGWWAMTTTDGETWSEPVNLDVPIVTNHPPQPLRSGRLLACGNIMFPYTDDPAGLTAWRRGGLFPAQKTASIVDDSEGFWKVKDAQGWPTGLCEGSFFQTPDGIIHMMLRSMEGRLWTTQSHDNAQNWSAPQPTGFTDNGAKFHFGQLPDGRFYAVSNPDPQGQRNPLMLSLSRDGVDFSDHHIIADEPYRARHDGLYKGGDYGYPHSMVHGGQFYVITSHGKESISVMRFPLSALGKP